MITHRLRLRGTSYGQPRQYRRERRNTVLTVESLEDRHLLAVVWGDEISIATTPLRLEASGFFDSGLRVRPAANGVTTDDAGDFYWHNGEKIRLTRLKSEVVVGIADRGAQDSLLSSLTTKGSPLEGWELSQHLDAETVLLRHAGPRVPAHQCGMW